MTKQMTGKVAIVTGGSAGMGQAASLAFAREGTKVVVADLNEAGGSETVERIRRNGGDAVFIKTDVTQASNVKAMVDKTVETFGQLNYAFNNAGLLPAGNVDNLIEMSEENWDRIQGVNLKGVWLCMKYEIPQMLKNGGGAIVNTSSVFGIVGAPGLPAYVSSKFGVVGLTKVAALQFSKQGVRVNAICPGSTLTPGLEALMKLQGDDVKSGEKKRLAFHPIGRLGTPEDMAEAAVWLCSRAASFVTGVALPVDGAFSAQ
jgi:NAD(P)-dependent dehydrogenase (short-subunit alcohol dehydrogenase family)